MTSRFKRQPGSKEKQGEPNPKEVARFGAGARQRGEVTVTERQRAVNVRLTEAELEILRRIAKAEDRAMQRTIRCLLMSAAEVEIKRLFGAV